jgi:hypothetical protein
VVSSPLSLCPARQPEGLKEMYGLINFYKENAKILKDTFQQMGFSVYGEWGWGAFVQFCCTFSAWTCMLCSWDDLVCKRSECCAGETHVLGHTRHAPHVTVSPQRHVVCMKTGG